MSYFAGIWGTSCAHHSLMHCMIVLMMPHARLGDCVLLTHASSHAAALHQSSCKLSNSLMQCCLLTWPGVITGSLIR